MNLLMTSEHRVGSRWIHYLLADLLNKGTYPEIDGSKIKSRINEIKGAMPTKIVKFHQATPEKIFDLIVPINYKLLAIVRNPRDRGVSFAFHYRYHPKARKKQKKLGSDMEAVEYTFNTDRMFISETKRQYKLMLDGYSSRNKTKHDLPYVWTTYEWLKEDSFEELSNVLSALNIGVPERSLRSAIVNNSFQAKSGRKVGQEKRTDTWRRKGVVGDWQNWLSDELVEETEEDWNKYWEIVNRNN